jgi:hypothetical protein
MSGSHWPIDRRIPLTLLAAIFVQTLTLVGIGSWYLSAYNSRIVAVEDELRRTSDSLKTESVASKLKADQFQKKQGKFETAVARLEERMAAANSTLSRIEWLMKDLKDDRPPPRRME